MATKPTGSKAVKPGKPSVPSYANKPWLKHYTMECPPEISYRKIPLPEFLEISARDYPSIPP